jgi:hypothetical protein
VEALDLYASVLALFGAALVLAVARLAKKKQLISKYPVPVRVRYRRRQS